MSDERLTDPRPRGPAPTPSQRGRRAAVLHLLRESAEPLGAAEIARRAGIHLNTARFHLDALVADDQAARDTLPRTTPGRPKVVYRAAPTPAAAAASDTRSFRLLADILAGALSASMPDPVGVATEAGRTWGRHLTASPAPTEHIDADEAQRRIVASFERMGFAPDADEHGVERELRLHHCPFQEVAQHTPGVVCSIHLGLLQGTIDQLGAPLVAEGLTPFVEPHLCVARLRRTGAAPGVTPAAHITATLTGGPPLAEGHPMTM
ncbi:helix-turn-helix domain-containing protein [Streptomyces sp. NPDC006430]|uniref:helix-turn-helix transcriptional regulator n=1 Tax=Streptomyces sp. NPDC006430 TaxID=3154299 RepID=UPI0033A08E63